MFDKFKDFIFKTINSKYFYIGILIDELILKFYEYSKSNISSFL